MDGTLHIVQLYGRPNWPNGLGNPTLCNGKLSNTVTELCMSVCVCVCVICQYAIYVIVMCVCVCVWLSYHNVHSTMLFARFTI